MIELNETSIAEGIIEIDLPRSKSIANRELMVIALGGYPATILPANTADDIVALRDALFTNLSKIDIGHAGTAMRFATAFYATNDREVRLEGSDRMHQRPIQILVDALNSLGADIHYLEEDGYPPLHIGSKKAFGGAIEVPGSISSQFISALLLCGASFTKGLDLRIKEPITSRPYIQLTINVLKRFGIEVEQKQNRIRITPQSVQERPSSDEKDWSAAAFLYGFVAQGAPKAITFPGLDGQSAQGDTMAMHYFEKLGVKTIMLANGVSIEQVEIPPGPFEADLTDHPDLAQALAFTCAAIGKDCYLKGLHTLRIKETDRIAAISESLIKTGLTVEHTSDSLQISGTISNKAVLEFNTYNDHRMAMAISILLPRLGQIRIKNEGVVSKSYPDYWNSLLKAGIATGSKI